MKFLALLLIVSSPVWSKSIPINNDDASKLGNLLMKIPEAFDKSEDMTEFVRKSFSFPKEKASPFRISCEGDYYQSSKVPSKTRCQFAVTVKDDSKDEYLTEVSDVAVVAALYKAISYGDPLKTLYSTERIWGQALDGRMKELFRYSFLCDKKSCRVTTVSRSAE